MTAHLRGDDERVRASLGKQPTPFKKVLLNRGASLGFPSGTPKRKSLRKSNVEHAAVVGDSNAESTVPGEPQSVQPSNDVRDTFSPHIVRRLNRHIRFSISDDLDEASGDGAALMKESADTVAATLTQISVDAFAIELEKGGLGAGEAYHEAVSEYLAQPSAFAPMTEPDGTPRAARRRESLMLSLEKKGAESLVDDQGDLVSHLTQEELALIDGYAEKIEASGIEKLEAYALALDSFVRGIENCHNRRRNSVSSVDMEEPRQSSTLRDLFESSATDYDGDEDNDMQLVEIYAEEIVANAGIDSAIVYGIALDSFTADPEAFRRHVKAIYPAFRSKTFDNEISVATSLFKELPHDPYTESYGASLRKLFKLPFEYNEDDDAIDIMLVERYADEIQEIAGLSEDIAYGVALDSFIADPTEFRCRHMRLMKSSDERRAPSGRDTSISSFGASLQRLFKLPADYSTDHDRDVEYVETYAKILQDNASIDEAIAYGLALDAFNADPVEFRKRILLLQRRPNEEGTEPLFSELHLTEGSFADMPADLSAQPFSQHPSSTSLNELLQEAFLERHETDDNPNLEHPGDLPSVDRGSDDPSNANKADWPEKDLHSSSEIGYDHGTAKVDSSTQDTLETTSVFPSAIVENIKILHSENTHPIITEPSENESEELGVKLNGADFQAQDVEVTVTNHTESNEPKIVEPAETMTLPAAIANHANNAESKAEITGVNDEGREVTVIPDAVMDDCGNESKSPAAVAAVSTRRRKRNVNDGETIGTPQVITRRGARNLENAGTAITNIAVQVEEVVSIPKKKGRIARDAEAACAAADDDDEVEEEDNDDGPNKRRRVANKIAGSVPEVADAEDNSDAIEASVIVSSKRDGRVRKKGTASKTPATMTMSTRRRKIDESDHPAEEDGSKMENKIAPKRSRRASKKLEPDETIAPPRRTRKEVASPKSFSSDQPTTRSRKSNVKSPSGVKPVNAKRTKTENLVLLCDGCDGEFSLKALGLRSVPKGDWYCTVCEKRRAKASAQTEINSRSSRSRK